MQTKVLSQFKASADGLRNSCETLTIGCDGDRASSVEPHVSFCIRRDNVTVDLTCVHSQTG